MTKVDISNKIETGKVTPDELLDLKKKLANKIVDKLGIPGIFKKLTVEYLIDKGTLVDLARDKLIGKLGVEAGLITPALDEYRKELSKLKTKSELEDFYTKNFDDKGGIEIASTGVKESGTTTSSSSQSSSSEESKNKSDSSTDSNKSDDSKKSKEDKSDKSSESSTGSNEKAKVSSSKESHEIDHINIKVSQEFKKIWEGLKGKEKPDLEPFACGRKAFQIEKKNGNVKNTKYLTIVDFTKNQIKDNRCWLINTETFTVEDAEKCGHGQGSGGAEWANRFSNKKGSLQSSLGTFFTSDKPRKNGKGTWLGNFVKGQEKGINDNSYSRGIAFHPVKSETYRSGKSTSEGCFTIQGSQSKVNGLMDKINGGSVLFAYAKDKNYFDKSKYFQKNSDGSYAA